MYRLMSMPSTDAGSWSFKWNFSAVRLEFVHSCTPVCLHDCSCLNITCSWTCFCNCTIKVKKLKKLQDCHYVSHFASCSASPSIVTMVITGKTILLNPLEVHLHITDKPRFSVIVSQEGFHRISYPPIAR